MAKCSLCRIVLLPWKYIFIRGLPPTGVDMMILLPSGNHSTASRKAGARPKSVTEMDSPDGLPYGTAQAVEAKLNLSQVSKD